MSDFDVVVVGGGPAGLAAAIACTRRGLGVKLLERRRPPIDKACGEGLMPSAVAALAALGVERAALRGRPIRGIAWRDGARVATGDFHGAALGVRRTRLHAALVSAAERAGVCLHFGETVRGLAPDGVSTGAGAVRGRFVVGADGLHSRVRRWAGLASRRGRRVRFGVRRHFDVAPWSEHVEITWARGAEAYVTPVGASEVGVALLVDGAADRHGATTFDALLAGHFPRLVERLAGAAPVSEERGAGPFRLHVPRIVTDRVALIGDASGYVDPITGEGLGLAFRQALVLAPALSSGDLAAYARAARRIVRPHERLTGTLLALQRRPLARSALIALLARAPALFERLLDAHGGRSAA